jgi:hypothetical protein
MLRIALKCRAFLSRKSHHNLRNGSPIGKTDRPPEGTTAPMFLMPVAGASCSRRTLTGSTGSTSFEEAGRITGVLKTPPNFSFA